MRDWASWQTDTLYSVTAARCGAWETRCCAEDWKSAWQCKAPAASLLHARGHGQQGLSTTLTLRLQVELVQLHTAAHQVGL